MFKNNTKVEIGSYPFFKAGKLGVSIVLRSKNKDNINKSLKEIMDFINKKKFKLLKINYVIFCLWK